MTTSAIVVLSMHALDLISRKLVLIDSKSNKARDMLLLLPRLDVEADVAQNALFLLWAAILDHELTGHGCSNTRLNLEHDIDFLFAEELSCFGGCLCILLIIALNSFLADERIVHLG